MPTVAGLTWANLHRLNKQAAAAGASTNQLPRQSPINTESAEGGGGGRGGEGMVFLRSAAAAVTAAWRSTLAWREAGGYRNMISPGARMAH